MVDHDPDRVAAQVLAGEVRAAARVMRELDDGLPRAVEVLKRLYPHSGRAFVLGITGNPGAGKSTLVDVLIERLRRQGKRVGVVAVDPTSPFSGGAILGDRIRMSRHATDPGVFIRSLATRGHLGGLSRSTGDVVTVLDAMGFDVVIVETVGVGQSETAVADMTDMFVLIHAPGGGDELQGVKRGIMELADMVVVNKADGDLLPAARRAAADLSGALHLMRPKHKGWSPPVLQVSALEDRGVETVWAEILKFRAIIGEDGLAALRQDQARSWMWADVRDGLLQALSADEETASEAERLETEVAAGRMTPPKAAQILLRRFLEP